MVVIKIMQGLGNQMFQYAAGRALSLHLNEPLKVNIDNYTEDSVRQYELSKYFNIDVETVTKEDMSNFDLAHPVRKIWNRLSPFKRIRSLPYEETNVAVKILYKICYLFRKPHLQKVYEEKQYHFDEDLFSTRSTVFLKGYWQSYKYFDKYKEQIKKEFIIKQHLVTHLSDTAQEMHNCNSIALHIRCTDKILPTHLKLHGEVNRFFYKKAIDSIESRFPGGNVCLYIFTDDVDVAKQYIPRDYPVVWVSGNLTKTTIEDFYLMQQTRGIVTSNSTFSWWAAYLNVHVNPVVVVPAKWYATSRYNAKDVYCPEWIKISL